MEDLNLRQLSKTIAGREKIVKGITQMGPNSYLRDRNYMSWEMFNNTGDDAEFEFLTQVGSFSLPAKIRRIPIQRSKANILLSQQSLRKTKYGIKTIDSSGISKKLTMMYQSMMMLFSQYANEQYRTIEFQIQQIDSQVAQMQQMLEAEPTSSEEQAQQAQIRESLPQIVYQTTMVKDNMAQAMSMTKEKRDDFLRKFKDDYEDIYEIYAHKLLVKIREDMDTNAASLKSFRNKIVDGSEFFYTNFNWKTQELEYRAISQNQISYPNIEDITWTQDLPWIVYETHMTKEQIRKNFVLTATELDVLEKMTISNQQESGAFVAGPGQVVVLDNKAGEPKKYALTGSGISVKMIWWRTDHEIKAIQSPNKFKEGGFFTNFVDDREFLDIKENNYSKDEKGEEIYTNKKTGVVKKKSDVNIFNSNKGQKSAVRYFDKRYAGVSISNGAIVLSGEDAIQPHPQDNYGYTPLPIVGKTNNGIGESPYSIIWATSELQKQYWVVSYHRELTFALAGASGVVFDLSQKPDGMDKEEWFYHMKLGRYLIQTITKSGGRKNTGFNQFSKVDQTLTSSIQYFGAILDGIEEQIGTLMGVPRQRQGEVQSSDQVGTFEQSNRQAMLVTEIMFKEHDEIESKALEQLLGLSIQYRYKPNEIVDVTDEESELITLPYDMKDRKFRMKLINSAKQDLDLEEMKRMSAQMTANGNLPFPFLFKIFSIDSLKELEHVIAEQDQKQQELAMLQQQKGIEAEAAAKQKELEIQQNFDKAMKGMEVKLADAKLNLEKYLGERKLDIEEKKVDIAAQQKDADSQVSTEEKGIKLRQEDRKQTETERKNRMDEALKATELELEALLKSTGVSQGLGISGS